jgi:hypothetical protein
VRAWLDWSQDDLAKRASVSLSRRAIRLPPIRFPRAIFMQSGFCLLGHDASQVAALLSFSARWVRLLLRKRYNDHGPDSLGDRRQSYGSAPVILTPEALTLLKERLKTPPEDGGLWTGPKVARWLARLHKLETVHDQRGWDALIAIDYSIQKPRPRHPNAAGEEDRAALKKNCGTQPKEKSVIIQAPSAAPVRPETSISISRSAAKPIISRRISASGVFSINVRRLIISLVIGGSPVCVGSRNPILPLSRR